ncbi:MAG: hypothetical protein MJ056_04845, partial [Akkermansia sp.]|nr:hypothetical protein [Akkermansia sp.]
MKLHLPAKLFRAVLACCAVAAFSYTAFADVPADYTKVTITSVDQLGDYTSSNYIAFLISANITNSTYRMTGGHQYWIDDALHTHVLTFSGFEGSSDCAAVNAWSAFSAEQFKGVTFNGNSSSSNAIAYGGAICASGTLNLTGNGSVTFSGNSLTSHNNAYGGAIYGRTISLSDNESVEFINNHVSSNSSHGGAIAYSNFTLSGNGSVVFSDNSAASTADSAYGGAIYGYSNSTITLSNNESVMFYGNSSIASRYHVSHGGAIYGDSNSTITLSDNESVEFSGNSAAYGGAIFGSTITLSGNGSVEFSGNSSTSSSAYGGAIYG